MFCLFYHNKIKSLRAMTSEGTVQKEKKSDVHKPIWICVQNVMLSEKSKLQRYVKYDILSEN